MKKFLPGLAVAILLAPGWQQPSEAGEVTITMSNGRVTLIAHDVTVRQILEEWARVGQTRIVNGDKILGPPVTLEMHDQPEVKVLDAVLRSAAGYVVAPRVEGVGPSLYDRIMILATSRAPAVTTPPPTFNRPPAPQPVVPAVEDDQVVDDQGVPQPGMVPPPGAQPFPGPAPPPGPQQPTTSPRPGMPPAPVVPGNPYQTPGARPPGGIVPGATPGQPGAPGAPGTPGGPPVGPGGIPGGGPGSGSGGV